MALLKVRKEKVQNGPVFAIKYDPRLPPIQSSEAKKKYREMTDLNNYLKKVFLNPPLTAFRRQNNHRDILIKAKVHQHLADILGDKLKVCKSWDKIAQHVPISSQKNT